MTDYLCFVALVVGVVMGRDPAAGQQRGLGLGQPRARQQDVDIGEDPTARRRQARRDIGRLRVRPRLVDPCRACQHHARDAIRVQRAKAQRDARAQRDAAHRRLLDAQMIQQRHRVIGKDKSLTGYGGGFDVKKYLLAHELGTDIENLPFSDCSRRTVG